MVVANYRVSQQTFLTYLFNFLLNFGGGYTGTLIVSRADTERAEHIQIIITSTQEADNVIPYQLRLLVKS